MTPPKAGTAEQAEKTLTEYVVLQLVELPGDPQDGGGGEAWVRAGAAIATNKNAAIDKVAGELIGKFKAVSAKSWKGGKVHSEPEKPAVASAPLED